MQGEGDAPQRRVPHPPPRAYYTSPRLAFVDPADVTGPDYPSETSRVLKDKELRATANTAPAAWDRLQADGTFADLGMG